MFETLFCDEEKRLILNLEEIRADYVSRKYHRDPYGKVFVTCPSGRYPLFAYLSRIVGMRGARLALEKFRAEKLTALNDEEYKTILLQKQNNLEELLRRSFYYYYYAEPDKIADTDDFLGAFMNFVYDDEYDPRSFAEGVRDSVHQSPEAWEDEQKAFAKGMERMNKHENCDSAEAAKEAILASVVCAGTSGMSQEELQKAVYEHATGEYYLSCLDIASNRYASPVLALEENISSPMAFDSYFDNARRQLNNQNLVQVMAGSTITAVDSFIKNEAAKMNATDKNKWYKDAGVAINSAWRGRRSYAHDDYEEASHLRYREYGPSIER